MTHRDKVASPSVCRLLSGLIVAASVTIFSLWSTPWADELHTLPQAPVVAAPPLTAVTIKSAIPPYVDQGVTMVPMRPLCSFLGAGITYHDSILTIFRSAAPGNPGSNSLSVTLRAGGETAQIRNGSELRTVRLPLPAEERLGTTFLPARFFAEAFGAEIFLEKGGGVQIKSGERTGVLQPLTQPVYNGNDAARVTIVNHVGRALSIRLTGPQNLALELGRKQSVTRTLKPGVYYYRAASIGMKTVKGTRRLLAGRKATWSWGRR